MRCSRRFIQRWFGKLLPAFAVAWAGTANRASAQVTDYAVPGAPSINVPIPTGQPGTHGIYTFGEFVLLTQTWTLGDQRVAVRGLVDSRGVVTGSIAADGTVVPTNPGTYIGSGVEALNTNDFARRSWSPGFNIGVGYAFENGLSVQVSYMHLMSNNYAAGATLAAPFFRGRADLSDTFLVAGVFNFPPQYAGPLVKTTADDANGNGTADPGEGGNFYGIWNGASVMDIQFNQWYNQAEITARFPIFQTEYSRIYGLAGGKFAHIMERFKWRTVSYDISGQAGPRDAALYSNTLSQRMYGPFIGCGHEINQGKFGLSLDLTAAGLLNFVKERAKYKLQSNEIQNKLSREEFTIVPNFNAHLNITWYPIEGVEMRVGYQAMTYFNTMNMRNPIGFNYGSIDPVYDTQVFRLFHGVNVGLGIFF